jgi:hypothetical protein
MGGTSSDSWLLDVHQGIGEKVSFDGEPLECSGHSAHSVKLVDGTATISVFGGWTSSGVVANSCFYQWNPRQPNVLHCGLAPEGATLKPLK